MASNSKRPLGAESDFIKGDSDNMVLLGHPMLDSLMQIVFALGAEVWSGQKRVKIIEQLLATQGKVTPEMIEQYVPSEEEEAQWAAERKAMVDRVYSVMSRNTATANTLYFAPYQPRPTLSILGLTGPGYLSRYPLRRVLSWRQRPGKTRAEQNQYALRAGPMAAAYVPHPRLRGRSLRTGALSGYRYGNPTSALSPKPHRPPSSTPTCTSPLHRRGIRAIGIDTPRFWRI